MYTPIVIKIGTPSNARRRSEEADDAPQLSSPTPAISSASPTMPVLSLNASEEVDASRTNEEPRKPIDPDGMFGRYEHNSFESSSIGTSNKPLKVERDTSVASQPATGSNAKTWMQPLVPTATNFSPLELAAPLGAPKVKSSEQSPPTSVAPVATGDQIAPPKSANAVTSSPSVMELLNVDAINQASADDGPRAADIINSKQETLVCHHESFLCTRPVIFGELYCSAHLPMHSKKALRCNYVNSESEEECDEHSVGDVHSMNGLCPKHSTLADARRSAFNKESEGKRTIASFLAAESAKDNGQWPDIRNGRSARNANTSSHDQGITQDMTFPLSTRDWAAASSLELSDQPCEHIRFDPLMYIGSLNSVQLIAILRDKYDELLECLAKHCTAVHHIIKLKKKLAAKNKIAPEGFEPDDPEIAEKIALFKRYMKPRHESAFIYEMKKRKRARKAFDSDPKTKCEYAEGELSCDHAALPSSKFCIDHVLCDERQSLFTKCEESGCNKPRKLWDKFCADHATVSVAERISQARAASMKRPVAEVDEDEESDDPNRRRSVRLKKRLRKHVKLNKDGTYVYEYSPRSMSELERYAEPPISSTHGSRGHRDSAQQESEGVSEPSGNSDPSMTAELALLDHQYGGASFSMNAKKDLDSAEEASEGQWD